jgi:type IV pilus assembly protein PilV
MVKKFKSAEPRSDAGFTLIEVMIAMTILSVGLMSIAVAQVTAIKVSSRSKHMQDAMFLAREEMDTLQAITPDPDPAVPSFFGTPKTISDPDMQLGSDTEDGTRYSRQTQITPGQPAAGLARVVVTVTWNNANNVPGTSQVQLGSVMRIN